MRVYLHITYIHIYIHAGDVEQAKEVLRVYHVCECVHVCVCVCVYACVCACVVNVCVCVRVW